MIYYSILYAILSIGNKTSLGYHKSHEQTSGYYYRCRHGWNGGGN